MRGGRGEAGRGQRGQRGQPGLTGQRSDAHRPCVFDAHEARTGLRLRTTRIPSRSRMMDPAMQSIDANASSVTVPGESGAAAFAGGCARVGTDIVAVAAIAESIARFGDKYLARVFTPAEIAYCASRAESAPLHYAARFAAKEAAMKVLRPSKDDAIDWQSIEVVRSQTGACEIVLRGAAEALAQRAGIASLAVSLSHEAAYAVAVVLANVPSVSSMASMQAKAASRPSYLSSVSRIATGPSAGFKSVRTAKVGSGLGCRGSRGGVSVR